MKVFLHTYRCNCHTSVYRTVFFHTVSLTAHAEKDTATQAAILVCNSQQGVAEGYF